MYLASLCNHRVLNRDFSRNSGTQGLFLCLRVHLVRVIKLARVGPGFIFERSFYKNLI